ncbi:sensor histidine kinase [Streptacidiphilus neutrinimicus]|uniref:sensor histidine kinase n=1 Tax=Streptacidiphilus neutrinimicus TaxID=105420 RepID=UPI0007C7538C|nr:ATP-binding protein [Streptacidiphilus neutrinimicus]
MFSRRKLSGRILVNQLVILAVTSVIGFVLLAFAQRSQIDHVNEQRALAIAQIAAADPQIVTAMSAGDPGRGPHGPVQTAATRIMNAAQARYVVVIDRGGIRHSHPIVGEIGQRVTEPVVALDGSDHFFIDNGSRGRSANARTPLRDPSGRIIGEVSVGIDERDVVHSLLGELSVFALYIGIALAVGVLASYALAWRLKRTTFGLELEEIAGLLQDREAMLHGIREGVVAFDQSGKVSVVNDEARRLLGLGTALGCRLEDLLPEGRLRRALAGELGPDEIHVLTDSHCLAINRMPVVLHGRALGAVVTVRDRTEIVGMLRELDSVRGLTDALRAQQHEFANRMHTLAGLLELGEQEQALEYAVELASTDRTQAAEIRERIANSLMVGLIVAKCTVAAERGVRLTLDPASKLGAEPGHLRRLLTVVGNLLDNAVDAAGSPTPPSQAVAAEHVVPAASGPPRVELLILETADAITVRVSDNGPGVPDEARAHIFEDGWSTRPDRGTARRGLGLAMVHRLVTRHGGEISVSEGPGAVFTVLLPLPDTEPAPLGAVFISAPPVVELEAGGSGAGLGSALGAGTAVGTGNAGRRTTAGPNSGRTRW